MGGAELQVLAPGNDSSNSKQDGTEHASVLPCVDGMQL